jgi:uncharacterized membrane protein YeaQ/YmgE (transglycosylase-associated protein family)
MEGLNRSKVECIHSYKGLLKASTAKEDTMLASLLVLADGVTIKIGSNVWSFGLNFILYLIIAAIVGLIAEYIVGWRLPLGIIGAIVAALVGIWLMTQVIVITGIGDIYLFGVPIIRALLGAIILVAIWHLLTYGLTRRRYRTA